MPPQQRVKVGVAGCGVVATAYYLPCLFQLEAVELVAVCDLYPERTAACQRLFGARETYQDYATMLRQADIQAVLILTAPGTHVDFTLQALQAGKHVLLQKPMALDLDGALAIAEAARRSGLVVLVEPSSNTPLDPDIAELRRLIDLGVLGKPYWFSFFESRPEGPHPSLGGNPYGLGAFYSADSGGVLFDYPYAPNLIVALLGSCTSVSGLARLSVPERFIVPEQGYDQFLQQASDPLNSNYWEVVVDLPRSQRVQMGAPDNVFSLYEMASGYTGIFHVGRPFLPVLPGSGAGGLMIFGSEGNLINGAILTRRTDLLPRLDPDGWVHLPPRGDLSRARWPIPVPGAFNYYHESTRHFIDCIQTGKQPLPGVDWGLHVTEMLHGALWSSRTGVRYAMTTRLPNEGLHP
jgi:predicted dehydrogenase